MANETTTSTLDDITNASLVLPLIINALSEKPGLAIAACREFDLTQGFASNVVKLPVETSWWGTPYDRGASIDTELDATQGTALSNTAFSTGVVTLTCAEYGVAAALTDNVAEDSAISGSELLTRFMGRMLHALTLALDDDYCALFASLSNSVGTSGADLTVAQALAANQGIRRRGAMADRLWYILDQQQVDDLQNALIAGNAAAAVYALSADRILNVSAGPNNGIGYDRTALQFSGYPVIGSGLTDSANAGADVSGACIVPTSAANDDSGATTHGLAWKRMPKFETQRQAKGRSTDLVMTMRAGLAELQDGAGTSIVTDL